MYSMTVLLPMRMVRRDDEMAEDEDHLYPSYYYAVFIVHYKSWEECNDLPLP